MSNDNQIPNSVKSNDTDDQRAFNRKLLAQIPADRQLGVMIALQDAVRYERDPFAALHRQGFLLSMVKEGRING